MTLEERLRSAASMSGLLFSPHPRFGGWKTTRALSPEIVAFKNDEVEPRFDRLAVEFHEGGVEDLDGYTPTGDEYRIVPHDRGKFGVEVEVKGSAEEALSRVAEMMRIAVAERRYLEE